ncbi:MAG: endo alpha-1,4 polygalactosaminidase [Bdellovibrionales bacterium]
MKSTILRGWFVLGMLPYAWPLAQATESPAINMSVRTGTYSGREAGLARANEGAVIHFYSNHSGNLSVTFSAPTSKLLSPIVLKARFKQNTAGDAFRFQARNSSGTWETLGSATAATTFQDLRFSIPARMLANQVVRLRLLATNSNDCTLDYLVLSDERVESPSPSPSPTPTPNPTPAPSPSPAPAPTPTSGIKPPPAGKVAWDWQIGANTDSQIIPPAGTKLIDVDGFNTSATKVAQLKSQGLYTVCYINAGSWESYRPDSDEYPDHLKIHYDSDWDEWFLDVRDVFRPDSALARILRARIKMCKDKGFDALEPDNLQNDENAGGKITLQEQIDFNGWIADVAHEYGLAVFQKNGPDKILKVDRTGKRMVDKFDGILNEECQQYNECAPLAEYSKRGKLVLNVEYRRGLTLNCNLANSIQMNTMKRDLNLAGPNMRGYLRETCP